MLPQLLSTCSLTSFSMYSFVILMRGPIYQLSSLPLCRTQSIFCYYCHSADFSSSYLSIFLNLFSFPPFPSICLHIFLLVGLERFLLFLICCFSCSSNWQIISGTLQRLLIGSHVFYLNPFHLTKYSTTFQQLILLARIFSTSYKDSTSLSDIFYYKNRRIDSGRSNHTQGICIQK